MHGDFLLCVAQRDDSLRLIDNWCYALSATHPALRASAGPTWRALHGRAVRTTLPAPGALTLLTGDLAGGPCSAGTVSPGFSPQAWATRLEGTRVSFAGAALAAGPTTTVTAIRDPIGLSPLYHLVSAGVLWIASSVALLPTTTEWDLEFVADFIAYGGSSPARTVYRGVQPVQPGRSMTWAGSRVSVRDYWTAPRPSSLRVDDAEAAAHLRCLIESAVARDCLGEGRAWCDLSGGLDSSSVVCVAQGSPAAADRRPGGSLTIVNGTGSGEAPRSVDAVVRRYPHRNERVAGHLPWDCPSPVTHVPALPTRDFPFHAEHGVVQRVLNEAGATRLLSGAGPEHYLPFTSAHAAGVVLTEGSTETAPSRRIWPRLIRSKAWPTLPAWVQPRFARATNLRERMTPRGLPTWGVHRGAQRIRSLHLRAATHARRCLPGVEIRHPLMSREIVEWCLGLPLERTQSPSLAKGLLRTAMQEYLPSALLQGDDDGSRAAGQIRQALHAHRRRIAQLLRRSVLADLGVLDPSRLREHVEAIAAGRAALDDATYAVLSLETWLAAKDGRYGGGGA